MLHRYVMKYNRTFFLLFVLATSCRVVFTGDFKPASQPKHPAASLPEKTFEAFWQTFEDHYAFFALRGVDWHAAYQQYRPRVNSKTSNDSLFSVLSEMVKPFQDEHITIYYPQKKTYREFTPVKHSQFLQEFPDKAAQEKFWHMVDHTLLNNEFAPLKTAGPRIDGVPLFTYSHSSTTAYLRFTRCNASEETENNEKKDTALAARVLDSLMTDFNDSQHIIIDIRNNDGGNDPFSFAVAGRFTHQKVLGHYKQFRTGGYNDFSPLVAHYIEPHSNPFTKRITVLTNDQTVSAADVFAMIMNELPQTTLIGTNSMGIFSDMYGFKLPNGWPASLSKERYLSAAMKCYEGMGMPVDVVIKNMRDDLATGIDPVIIRALQP